MLKPQVDVPTRVLWTQDSQLRKANTPGSNSSRVAVLVGSQLLQPRLRFSESSVFRPPPPPPMGFQVPHSLQGLRLINGLSWVASNLHGRGGGWVGWKRMKRQNT